LVWNERAGLKPLPSAKLNPTAEPLTLVCEIPDDLGRVTNLKLKNGKVIAETESGTPFIVPVK
jgi:hypothetical protein